jgi:S1-C subfamily serine protease
MSVPAIRLLALIAIIGASALLGSSRTAGACPPLMYHYGVHGIVLPGGGFLVQQVAPFSEAAWDGILNGDVIVQVNNV